MRRAVRAMHQRCFRRAFKRDQRESRGFVYLVATMIISSSLEDNASQLNTGLANRIKPLKRYFIDLKLCRLQ